MFTPTESKIHTGWFIIPSEPLYLASMDGRLKNVKTGHILLGTRAVNGYMVLNIWRSEKKRDQTMYIHRLICEAFHGPLVFPNTVVNHKDGDRSNNHYLNLEWVTHKDNIQHAIETGLTMNTIKSIVWDVLCDIKEKYESRDDIKKSIPELANALGSVTKKLSSHHPLFKDRYFVTNDGSELPELDTLRKRMIVVESLSTGKRYLVKNNRIATTLIGVSINAINMSIINRSYLCNGFIVSYYREGSVIDKQSIRDQLFKKTKYSSQKKRLVLVKNTNEIFFFSSSDELKAAFEWTDEEIFDLLYRSILGLEESTDIKLIFEAEARLMQSPHTVEL